jgi:hypothetical protein
MIIMMIMMYRYTTNATARKLRDNKRGGVPMHQLFGVCVCVCGCCCCCFYKLDGINTESPVNAVVITQDVIWGCQCTSLN